ncbi:hypothetical protein [Rubrolithibacter danxiaensis]|uniref:hypothetical protein n=1 Tax=Rubrolithibacter danxiaensis TaxID=3390805 RepID=UPI003BF924EA
MKKIALLSAALFSLTTAFAQTDDIVHKTGNETIDGNKTFTGTTSLSNTTFGAGIWTPYLNDVSVTGNYKVVTRNKTTGKLETIEPIALAGGGSLDESGLVHKELEETITGSKTFNGNTTFNTTHFTGPTYFTTIYAPYLNDNSTAGNYRIITKNQTTGKLESIDPTVLGGGGGVSSGASKTADETISGSWNFTNNIGIGIANPTDKLAVNGRIRAKEIKVETANFPDYVFRNDYPLLSLSDLEKFIKANNHLPEVPSAAEAERNGVDLGEMNKILLKKVEELTLHLIEQNKEISHLKKDIEALRKVN